MAIYDSNSLDTSLRLLISLEIGSLRIIVVDSSVYMSCGSPLVCEKETFFP